MKRVPTAGRGSAHRDSRFAGNRCAAMRLCLSRHFTERSCRRAGAQLTIAAEARLRCMGVKKINPRSMLYGRLLSETADDLRRSVKKTVMAARGEIHRSENILAQAHAAVEHAQKTVEISKQGRSERMSKQELARKNRRTKRDQ